MCVCDEVLCTEQASVLPVSWYGRNVADKHRGGTGPPTFSNFTHRESRVERKENGEKRCPFQLNLNIISKSFIAIIQIHAKYKNNRQNQACLT